MARQAASQPERKRVRQKANTDEDGRRKAARQIRRQSCRYIKTQKQITKQIKSKQRKASQGHTNTQRQTYKQTDPDPVRQGSM